MGTTGAPWSPRAADDDATTPKDWAELERVERSLALSAAILHQLMRTHPTSASWSPCEWADLERAERNLALAAATLNERVLRETYMGPWASLDVEFVRKVQAKSCPRRIVGTAGEQRFSVNFIFVCNQ
ncbi:hypothetical protein P8C59_005581 [Phyllachora maydis]|uniref:Uncharacterized protein n=1 Tax=Phyllachora maydis TaxID=1825666 RepID=A0AAD9MCE2_9PEZI|nr:hypothetical protein P8C59_005581 [Phyllachora maydis]